jgi:hypothetical protein
MDAPVKLIVTLGGAQPATLSRLPGLLFYPSEEKAMADIPEQFRFYIPAPADTLLPSDRLFGKDAPLCDCAKNDTLQCGHLTKSPGWIGPEPQTRFVRPPIPQEAKTSKKLDTAGSVVFRVEANGNATDFWIALPSGFGMDEMVLRMLSKMKYKPGMCHEKPTEDIVDYRYDLRLPVTSPH